MSEEILQVVEKLYYEENLSTRKVADLLHVTPQTVSYYLKKSSGLRDIKAACKLRTTDEYRKKIRATQIGELNTSAKLSEEEVIKIRNEYSQLLLITNKTQAQYELAEKYGVKRPTISDVVLRRSWKHI
ncbi:hypothetical protein [Neobacillus mesonae]|uniref:hypothetical protein n=1 Tax=Neobacillus mesonae TaxID=1193713 RepID=UPI002E1CF991|nr:hypothetical protein [Neobacillus mesonae]